MARFKLSKFLMFGTPQHFTLTFSMLALWVALGLLSACKQQTVIVCPQLIPYSKDFQAALDREIAQLDAPYLFQMLNDYGVTRDAIRKCIKHQKRK